MDQIKKMLLNSEKIIIVFGYSQVFIKKHCNQELSNVYEFGIELNIEDKYTLNSTEANSLILSLQEAREFLDTFSSRGDSVDSTLEILKTVKEKIVR